VAEIKAQRTAGGQQHFANRHPFSGSVVRWRESLKYAFLLADLDERLYTPPLRLLAEA
jgi:hypothetical protein